MPKTPKKWVEVSKQFYDQWDFPNAGGAMDGKEIYLESPPISGSAFHCYKKGFSTNLMAMAMLIKGLFGTMLVTTVLYIFYIQLNTLLKICRF